MQLLLRYRTGECANCGEPVYFGDVSHHDADGDLICDTCRREYYSVCDDCGELVYSEGLTRVSGGDWVCERCLENDYFLCHDCEEYHCNEERHEIGREIFCDRCADDWFECSDCGDLVNRRREECVTTRDGREICDRCYCENYFTCEDCGEVYHNDCRCCDEDGTCSYCESCWRERNECNLGVYDYHDFGKGRYSPRLTDGESPRKTLLYGVELECDDGRFDVSGFGRWTDDGNLIHFEHDGSLSDEGVELITMPCSLRFHQEEMEWERLLSVLRTQGFKSHSTDTCGLHVHISRRMLSPVTICKLDVFVNRAVGLFGQIARRDVLYHAGYDTEKRLSTLKGLSCRGDRYQAVNTTNLDTVEIRIFKGSLKTETVIGTVEMCDALVHFLQYIPVGKIYETDENVVRFVDWCGERSDVYPHVIPMMKRLVKEGDCVGNVDYWFNRIVKKQKEMMKCA